MSEPADSDLSMKQIEVEIERRRTESLRIQQQIEDAQLKRTKERASFLWWSLLVVCVAAVPLEFIALYVTPCTWGGGHGFEPVYDTPAVKAEDVSALVTVTEKMNGMTDGARMEWVASRVKEMQGKKVHEVVCLRCGRIASKVEKQ